MKAFLPFKWLTGRPLFPDAPLPNAFSECRFFLLPGKGAPGLPPCLFFFLPRVFSWADCALTGSHWCFGRMFWMLSFGCQNGCRGPVLFQWRDPLFLRCWRVCDEVFFFFFRHSSFVKGPLDRPTPAPPEGQFNNLVFFLVCKWCFHLLPFFLVFPPPRGQTVLAVCPQCSFFWTVFFLRHRPFDPLIRTPQKPLCNHLPAAPIPKKRECSRPSGGPPDPLFTFSSEVNLILRSFLLPPRLLKRPPPFSPD